MMMDIKAILCRFQKIKHAFVTKCLQKKVIRKELQRGTCVFINEQCNTDKILLRHSISRRIRRPSR
jgi:hypothetical protein